MSIVVCGSIAYDTRVMFDDKFKLSNPESKVTANPLLDIYFIVPDLRRNFGGCAGNIAYNLKLLGRQSFPMATVGIDFEPYANWMDTCGIKRDYIKIIHHNYTAQSFVMQDVEDNKITAFHPGAMTFSHFNRIPFNRDIKLGVIAPDGYEGMLLHARQFTELGVPILFYPGVAISQMNGDDLMAFIQQSRWVALNENEWQQVQQQTGFSPEQIAERVKALIINCHRNGALIYTHETCHHIPTHAPKIIQDLTGCDDAFCAGLLYGLSVDIDWETIGRIATLMWAIKAEHHGTQSHSFTITAFKSLFKKIFGYTLMSWEPGSKSNVSNA